MSQFAANIQIVDQDGKPTPQFLAALQAVENGAIPCLKADLPRPGIGWHRFLTDEGRPVWGDGTNWVYADGSIAA